MNGEEGGIPQQVFVGKKFDPTVIVVVNNFQVALATSISNKIKKLKKNFKKAKSSGNSGKAKKIKGQIKKLKKKLAAL